MESEHEKSPVFTLEDLYELIRSSANVYEDPSLDCQIVYYDNNGMQQLLAANSSAKTVSEAIETLGKLIAGKMGLPEVISFALQSIPRAEITKRHKYDTCWRHSIKIKQAKKDSSSY